MNRSLLTRLGLLLSVTWALLAVDATPAYTDPTDPAAPPTCMDACPADEDGDGACDTFDNCLALANAGQVDRDGDGLGDACDACPFDAGNDEDGDGVCANLDRCPGTALPEAVPTVKLGTNRFADVDGDGVFDTKPPKGNGPRVSFDLVDTRGCSCEQIIEARGLGQGHVKYGCSLGVMRGWIASVQGCEFDADCEDGNPCTQAVCVDGVCEETVLTGSPCEDGNPCVEGSVCDEDGGCGGGTASACDDGLACTLDCCEPTTGCLHTILDGWPCGLDDLCAGSGVCGADGACVGGEPVICDDGNPCTHDGCDPASGCTAEALPGVPCDDGDACTHAEACDASGACVGGEPVICDDGNPCTLDDCLADLGCVSAPAADGAPCDDGNPCTEGDQCLTGACGGSVGDVCVDLGPCRQTVCDPLVGWVESARPDGTPCSDGDPCTLGDVCQAGACVGSAALSCVDGNPCTDDACDPVTGCTFTPNAAACDDGNACTIEDACVDGMCAAGAMLDCDDGDVCTDDRCDMAAGCLHEANDHPCDDGDLCTQGDRCAAGACGGGAPLSCDDGNACTDDACDPATGCVFTPNEEACDDGDACTEGDACAGGACRGGSPRDCGDDNPCTADSCHPDQGCVYSSLNGVACTDDDPCTIGDVCTDGACGGTIRDCDDDDPCTADSCDLASGACTHAPIPGCCPAGLSDCDGHCVDLGSDDSHCGGCFNACPPDHACASGHCVLDCAPSLVACSGACVDIQSDEDHCGACGRACPAGYTCALGECVSPCAGFPCLTPPAPLCEGDWAIQYASPGTCSVDPYGDPICAYEPEWIDCAAMAQVCDGGQCAEPECWDNDWDGYEDAACGGDDCDDQDDGTNPGMVEWCDGRDNDCDGLIDDGATCPEGYECVAGGCAPVCDPGLTFCDGQCADLDTDPNHCGACGEDCAEGWDCIAGECVYPDPCDPNPCTNPPAGFCAGDVAYSYVSPGFCDWMGGQGYDCQYFDMTPTDCAALGQTCEGGQCVSDTCGRPASCDPEAFSTDGIAYSPIAAQDFEATGYADGTCWSGSSWMTHCQAPPLILDEVSYYGVGYADMDPANGSMSLGTGYSQGIPWESRMLVILGGRLVIEPSTPADSIAFDVATQASSIEVWVQTEDGQERHFDQALPPVGGYWGSAGFFGYCTGDDQARITRVIVACSDGGVDNIRVGHGGACESTCWDNDWDGYEDAACGGDDCDDEDDGTNPGMSEWCDGRDNDCDGLVDDDATCQAGYECVAGACEPIVTDPCDPNPCMTPPAPVCVDGTTRRAFSRPGVCSESRGGVVCDYPYADTDCAAQGLICDDGWCAADTCPDGDGDGYDDATCGGTDCDDTDPEVSPGEAEVCNGKDDDCDGTTDWSPDWLCGEGVYCSFGECTETPCDPNPCDTPPEGYCELTVRYAWSLPGDCLVDPNVTHCEYAFIVEDCAWYGQLCEAGECVDNPDPCDPNPCTSPPPGFCEGDYAITFNDPGFCDWMGGDDYDCQYFDTSFQDCAALGMACELGECVPATCWDNDWDGYTDVSCGGDDCDDSDDGTNPGMNEWCDGRDNDCDGLIDDGATCQAGYECVAGACEPNVTDPCDPNPCTTPPASSCVEDRALVYDPVGACYPDGPDVYCQYTFEWIDCGAMGQTCEDAQCVGGGCWDHDWDGYEDAACGGTDCDDSDDGTNPGMNEWCDGRDNDCDGAIDDGATCQAGYECVAGACEPIVTDPCDPNPCTNPPPDICEGSGLALQHQSPGACTDLGGGDTSCDYPYEWIDCPAGTSCEAGACVVPGCQDADNDGHEDAACGGSDCDDTDDGVYPGAPERCDGQDDDCDGAIDEDEVDCAALGQVCVDGQCVTDGPCGRPVTCDPEGFTEDEGAFAGIAVEDLEATGFATGTRWCSYDTETCLAPSLVLAGATISPAGDESLDPGTAWFWLSEEGDPAGVPMTTTHIASVVGRVLIEPLEPADSVAFDWLAMDPYNARVQVQTTDDAWHSFSLAEAGVSTDSGRVGFFGYCTGMSSLRIQRVVVRVADGGIDDLRVGHGGPCAGACVDFDGDGYDSAACGGPDCDDEDGGVYPGASEWCDSQDNDCDGQVDEGCPSCDPGQVYCLGSCVDLMTDEGNCGACYNTCSWDEACEAGVCVDDCPDLDGDGYTHSDCGGGDCDDWNADVHPGQEDVCDGIDNDCDALTDEDCLSCESWETICFDSYCASLPADPSNCGACGNACEAGQECINGECQAFEDCGRPPMCDPNSYVTDTGDFALIPAETFENTGIEDHTCLNTNNDDCPLPQPFTSNGVQYYGVGNNDYTPNNADIYLEGAGGISIPHPSRFLAIVSGRIMMLFDAPVDSIAFDFTTQKWTFWVMVFTTTGHHTFQVGGASVPGGTRGSFGYCPGDGSKIVRVVVALADGGIDNVRAGVGGVCAIPCEDADGDGHAAAACGGMDCDDGDDGVHPGVDESCNGRDDDCDGATDEGGAIDCETFYRDSDQDGFGQDADAQCLCGPEGEYTAPGGGDCDDGDATFHPGAQEICNGMDNDCDGVSDDDCVLVCKSNEIICDDACVLPSFDVTNCGACGVVCGPDQICDDGACVTPSACGRPVTCDAQGYQTDPAPFAAIPAIDFEDMAGLPEEQQCYYNTVGLCSPTPLTIEGVAFYGGPYDNLGEPGDEWGFAIQGAWAAGIPLDTWHLNNYGGQIIMTFSRPADSVAFDWGSQQEEATIQVWTSDGGHRTFVQPGIDGGQTYVGDYTGFFGYCTGDPAIQITKVAIAHSDGGVDNVRVGWGPACE